MDLVVAHMHASGFGIEAKRPKFLNLAVGGGLAEGRGLTGVDESGYPKNMEIDWVRVWQCDGDAGSGCGNTGDQAE